MKRLVFLCACLTGFIVSVQMVDAGVLLKASGVSGENVPISFEAELTISGDTLTIVLTNTSPVDSLYKADVLGSFYFDIINSNGDRPDLVYTSAFGDTYIGDKDGVDPLSQLGEDLKALPGKQGWIFVEMDDMSVPFLGFGIGTVGNSNWANDFPGMDGVETGIYKGDVTAQSLDGYLLIKETATFTFTGVDGFTEDDIVRDCAFGLGTAPDGYLTPEPATLMLLGLGGLLLRKRRV